MVTPEGNSQKEKKKKKKRKGNSLVMQLFAKDDGSVITLGRCCKADRWMEYTFFFTAFILP